MGWAVAPERTAGGWGRALGQAAAALCGFFKGLGVHYVYDVTFGRQIALLER